MLCALSLGRDKKEEGTKDVASAKRRCPKGIVEPSGTTETGSRAREERERLQGWTKRQKGGKERLPGTFCRLLTGKPGGA